jgi:hypothetical protein
VIVMEASPSVNRMHAADRVEGRPAMTICTN